MNDGFLSKSTLTLLNHINLTSNFSCRKTSLRLTGSIKIPLPVYLKWKYKLSLSLLVWNLDLSYRHVPSGMVSKWRSLIGQLIRWDLGSKICRPIRNHESSKQFTVISWQTGQTHWYVFSMWLILFFWQSQNANR